MNLDKLYEILKDTTREYRKGAMIEGASPLADALRSGAEDLSGVGGGVAEIYMIPPASEAPANLEMVDCEFIKIGVDKVRAEARRGELIEVLRDYPNPERLSGGPSYIEVGGVIGDQSAAFSLFALGKVLGLWGLITPSTFGFEGAEAREMAGAGFVMISPGFHASSAEQSLQHAPG